MVLDSTVDRDIERAAHRAYARDLSARFAGSRKAGHNGVEFFDVASFSTAGLFHRVRLDYTAAGVSATCDCLGSQHGRICAHVAVALEASQSLPAAQPEPEAKPVLGAAWLRAQMAGE